MRMAVRICTVLSLSTNPQRSFATPPVCLLERYSASTKIQGTSFNQRFLNTFVQNLHLSRHWYFDILFLKILLCMLKRSRSLRPTAKRWRERTLSPQKGRCCAGRAGCVCYAGKETDRTVSIPVRGTHREESSVPENHGFKPCVVCAEAKIPQGFALSLFFALRTVVHT